MAEHFYGWRHDQPETDRTLIPVCKLNLMGPVMFQAIQDDELPQCVFCLGYVSGITTLQYWLNLLTEQRGPDPRRTLPQEGMLISRFYAG